MNKLNYKLLTFIVTFIFLLIFTGYQAVKFYNNNIGPETCINNSSKLLMSRQEALQIADKSQCKNDGNIAPLGYLCNEVTGTWWLNLDVFNKKPGCSPACVVNIETKNAETNWRCTGLDIK